MVDEISNCDHAQARQRNLMMWRNLWTILLFIIGSAITIFASAAILLFVRQSWIPAAVTTVGTVVQGVAVTWVVKQRATAVKEEDRANSDVERLCGAQVAAEIRTSYSLM
jgi:hypothetical protein